MIDKFTKPPYGEKLVEKINDIIDDKQDVLVSGTNIKTINNTSLLGSGNIDIQGGSTITVDSALSTTSTNPVQNKIITNTLNGKLDGFTLQFAGNWSGGVHAVNFVTIDYSECDSERGVFIKFSMVNSHGNGQAGKFLQDIILNVTYTGVVAGTLYRYFAVPIDQASSEYYGSHYYGDVFWVNDTTNKIVRFYVLMHQYSYTSQSPYFRLNASTKGVITQATGGAGASEYSTGTRVWTTINWFETDQTYSATSQKPQSGVAVASAISTKQDTITSSNKLSASLVSGLSTVATSGSYNDLSNKPTIPDTSNLANKDLSNLSSTGNAKFQAPLISGTNIKTINNNSILGSGNLQLDGLPSQTGQSGKFLTTNGTTASWGNATLVTFRDWSVA